MDGIPVEFLRYGGDNLAIAINTIILAVLHGEPAPQDWIDAIMVSLYKGKGFKSECGAHRGINRLEAAGESSLQDFAESTDKVDMASCHPGESMRFQRWTRAVRWI